MARRAELAPFVELPVVGQIGLRHDAQHAAPVNDNSAVEQPVFKSQWRADQQNGRQLPAGRHDFLDARQHTPQEGILLEQVVDRIG